MNFSSFFAPVPFYDGKYNQSSVFLKKLFGLLL